MNFRDPAFGKLYVFGGFTLISGEDAASVYSCGTRWQCMEFLPVATTMHEFAENCSGEQSSHELMQNGRWVLGGIRLCFSDS